MFAKRSFATGDAPEHTVQATTAPREVLSSTDTEQAAGARTHLCLNFLGCLEPIFPAPPGYLLEAALSFGLNNV